MVNILILGGLGTPSHSLQCTLPISAPQSAPTFSFADSPFPPCFSTGGDGPRQLLPYLFSSKCPEKAKPSFVRVVDKFLAIPQADAFTFFADPRCKETFKKGMEDGSVEYIQGNLLTEGQ